MEQVRSSTANKVRIRWRAPTASERASPMADLVKSRVARGDRSGDVYSPPPFAVGLSAAVRAVP